ncbi:HAD-IIB family hydrolase [Maritimibacter alkaliphilus]|uniref:HAD-IIB family hydrolase n=1 Tax=Maritimibacter alkaliphilus TaxID=404236 RepID=UPI001C9625E1|nr:HAD-IIB family hydrolase [Maritimibacter alkaliphilus]MBY6089251.1 HAD-IIB family hydrolase [Maritimibacter alkaliphilus]
MTLPPFLVFTDLDGTLLDHESYAWEAARPALVKLQALRVPVILASSKTAAEIAPLRAELGLADYPAIAENGAGLLAPGAEPDAPGPAYRELRARLDKVAPGMRARFTGFGDWSDAEVAEVTGLPAENARLARIRAFSEPGVFDGTEAEEAAFVAALDGLGVTSRRGGRFLTLSLGGTKADRMAEAAAGWPGVRTVALGDAPNDVEMLQTADIGIVIANDHAKPLPPQEGEAEGRIRRSTKIGPAGWNEMMLKLVSDLREQEHG